MAGKRYHGRKPSEIRKHEFEVELYRGETPEVHEFTARPNTDLGPLIRLYQASDDPMTMGDTALKVLTKQMDDTDGVPLSWSPTILPKPKNAGPTYQPKFRGPDGKLYPMADQERFTDLTVGSSRRRWQYLVLEDDGVTIDIDLLVQVLQDLVSAGMDSRPTHA